MKFVVDSKLDLLETFNYSKQQEYGNISGSDKANATITKTYSGTFIDGQLTASVKWEDGRTATYSGKVLKSNKIAVDFLITAVGNIIKGSINDAGTNFGVIYEVYPVPFVN